MRSRMAQLAAIAGQAGRRAPGVTVYSVRPDRSVLDHYAELGVERCVVMAPSQRDSTTVIAELGRRLVGAPA